MLDFLKNHPFAVNAFFEKSIVLTFAVPKEELQLFLPEFLELNTFKGTWAFIAVAMVQTTGLRPAGFPKLLGNDFFLIGYRIFVTYKNNAGKKLRGLYILKSETDKKKMQILGNIFTHYKYTTTDITQTVSFDRTTIESKKSKFKIEITESDADIALPKNSPFSDWKEARRFAGPLPFTFTTHSEKKNILIIEGIRENWIPQPLDVTYYEFAFLNALPFKNIVLANAFIIKNIPYHWKKGRKETWKP